MNGSLYASASEVAQFLPPSAALIVIKELWEELKDSEEKTTGQKNTVSILAAVIDQELKNSGLDFFISHLERNKDEALMSFIRARDMTNG